MIARIWRGATRVEDADVYLEYMRTTGFAGYRETPGNLGVRALRQDITADAQPRTEFVIVSYWQSEDAIRAFAGDDMTRAVYYPEDDRYLIARDEYVAHFEVVYADGADA